MTALSTRRFDLAIIGAGVVGCAIFRRFALGGLKCLLIERGADILSGVSKANSAMLHTGFDAPPGSLCGHSRSVRSPFGAPWIRPVR